MPLLFVGALLLLGYVVGGHNERKHFHSLEIRESQTAHLLTTQLRSFPLLVAGQSPPTVLIGEAVISSDYMKTFLAFLRNIFGGEVKGFRSILERARREALVRLKEQAHQQGYNAVCNVRFETVDLAGRGAHSKNKIVLAAILVTATAYHTAPQAQVPTAQLASHG